MIRLHFVLIQRVLSQGCANPLWFVAALGFAVVGRCAEIPKAPVPPSPYLPVVYRYADAMLEKGRDTYGPQKTGLFLSALDRTTLAPLTNRPRAWGGIVDSVIRAGAKDGPLIGANLHHDENLLRLLYTLSELSSKPKYRDAADAALKWFLENTASPDTGLLPWGTRLSWNVIADTPTWKGDSARHGFFRPWLLWDRCFDLAPKASQRFALGLWEHQIANHTTGAFNMEVGFEKHAPFGSMDPARDAGFCIRTWAVAYARTKDERFLKAIEVLLGRFQRKRDAKTGLIEAYTGSTLSWPGSGLSLGIDCDGAAHRVPEPLSSRLRDFATREDELFCSLAHDVNSTHGFLFGVAKDTGALVDPRSTLWSDRYGSPVTAKVALMCVSRYDNTGKIGFRELIQAAADSYLNSLPAEGDDTRPGTFAQAISLQVAAWRHTAKPEYLDSARKFADIAVEKFWGTNALPRASFKSEHYESITGADTLALALVELHLQILGITAVRCPPNTIDR